MKKKVIIVLSIILIIGLLVLLFTFKSSKKAEHKSTENINKDITIENQNIEIINDEVFIEATLRNNNKETVKLNDVDIIVLNLNNKEVLKIKNEVNKELKPNESVLVSSQTKANLESTQTYKLKIDY